MNVQAVDALPYVDKGYDESKEAVSNLIEEECKRYRPTKNYLSHLPEPKYNDFETPLMKVEFDRMDSRLPLDLLSMKRYELPGPSSTKLSDPSAWLDAVKNAQAQLEHQEARLCNLDLLTDYGAEAWKAYNVQLEKMTKEAQDKLEALRKEILDINYDRKAKQLAAGDRLRQLEVKWVGLVSKNYEIEKAIIDLEQRLSKKRKI